MTDEELIKKLNSDEINVTDLSGSWTWIICSLSNGKFVYADGELYSKNRFDTNSYFVKYIKNCSDTMIDADYLEESDFEKIENSEVRQAIARSIVRYTADDGFVEVLFKDMPNYCNEYRKQMKEKEQKNQQITNKATSDKQPLIEQITEGQLIETLSGTDQSSDKKNNLNNSSLSNGLNSPNSSLSNNQTVEEQGNEK